MGFSVSYSNGGSLRIRSVQAFTITLTAPATSNTATISSVTTANCMLILTGSHGVQNSATDDFADLVLTNSTTVTATRTGTLGDMKVSGYVIEFEAGVIKSNQTGTISIGGGGTSNTGVITGVDTTKAIPLYLGCRSDSSSNSVNLYGADVTLTNGTTVTASRPSTTGNHTVRYQVVEFL